MIAASLTKPDDLGLPFGSWTLDRLTTYLHEEKGLAIGRRRIAAPSSGVAANVARRVVPVLPIFR